MDRFTRHIGICRCIKYQLFSFSDFMKSVDGFAADTEQFDDITLMIIRYE